jgi:lysozyme
MTLLDPRLVRFVTALEGVRLRAYRDTKGIPTIGIGSTTWPDGRPVKMGETCTMEEAQNMLTTRLAHDRALITAMVHQNLPSHAIDAATSFAYNVGMAGFKRSRTLKFLQAGDHISAADALMGWLKPPELKGRRLKEQALMARGYTDPLVLATLGDEA